MWQVPGGRASEQRQQRAPHPRDVLQKLSAERSGATSCDRLTTRGERVTPISAPDRMRAPVVYDDNPGDANGVAVGAKDGSLPAWALPLAVWQSGNGAMQARPARLRPVAREPRAAAAPASVGPASEGGERS